MSHIRHLHTAYGRTGRRLFSWIVGVTSTARAAMRRSSTGLAAAQISDRSGTTIPVAMGRVWREVDSHRDLLHLVRGSARAGDFAGDGTETRTDGLC